MVCTYTYAYIYNQDSNYTTSSNDNTSSHDSKYTTSSNNTTILVTLIAMDIVMAPGRSISRTRFSPFYESFCDDYNHTCLILIIFVCLSLRVGAPEQKYV